MQKSLFRQANITRQWKKWTWNNAYSPQKAKSIQIQNEILLLLPTVKCIHQGGVGGEAQITDSECPVNQMGMCGGEAQITDSECPVNQMGMCGGEVQITDSECPVNQMGMCGGEAQITNSEGPVNQMGMGGKGGVLTWHGIPICQNVYPLILVLLQLEEKKKKKKPPTPQSTHTD